MLQCDIASEQTACQSPFIWNSVCQRKTYQHICTVCFLLLKHCLYSILYQGMKVWRPSLKTVFRSRIPYLMWLAGMQGSKYVSKNEMLCKDVLKMYVILTFVCVCWFIISMLFFPYSSSEKTRQGHRFKDYKPPHMHRVCDVERNKEVIPYYCRSTIKRWEGCPLIFFTLLDIPFPKLSRNVKFKFSLCVLNVLCDFFRRPRIQILLYQSGKQACLVPRRRAFWANLWQAEW